jgi:ketosteroid isomerase-like protein
MSQENVEIVRGLYDTFAEGDNESPFEVYDSEIRWDVSGLQSSWGLMGFDSVYHGHEGVRRFWRQWLEAWRAIEFDLRELTDCGDSVLATIYQRNVGRESGIEIEQGTWWQVWTLRDGRVLTVKHFQDRAEALEAAGLSE